jgi:cation transport regulator ChaC
VFKAIIALKPRDLLRPRDTATADGSLLALLFGPLILLCTRCGGLAFAIVRKPHLQLRESLLDREGRAFVLARVVARVHGRALGFAALARHRDKFGAVQSAQRDVARQAAWALLWAGQFRRAAVT